MSHPEPLSLSVHSLPNLEPDGRRTAIGRWKMLLIWAVCAAPVIGSYLAYYVFKPQARSNYGQLIDPQRPLPGPQALPLTDLQGRAVDATRLRGQWLLMVVAGGRCDNRCEALLYQQRQLREMLGKDKDRLDRVWLVHDDEPVRDALRPALQDVWILRVAPDRLAAWLAPGSGQELPAHLYLVDPLGHWMMRFPPDAEPARVKRDLDKLMRAAASWDGAGRDPDDPLLRPSPAGR